MKEHGQKAACGGLTFETLGLGRLSLCWPCVGCGLPRPPASALCVAASGQTRTRRLQLRFFAPPSPAPETPSQPSARKHLQEQWHMMHREDITVAPLVLYVKAALQMGLLGIFDAALLRASRHV